MVARSEVRVRIDDRPLNAVETDDYEIVGDLTCSASGDKVFHTVETKVFCRAEQSLGEAMVSKVRYRPFRDSIYRLHMIHCEQPFPEVHDVFIDIRVVNRPPPPGLRPRFQVLGERGKKE